MDSPPKLSGETLIVHHIPLVHCQVSGGRQAGCGGSLKRTNPFSPPENLGLSRTTSLPERDIFQTEALLYSSLLHTSSCRRGGGIVSDNHSVDQPVSAHTLPRAKPRIRNPLRHNPFLLSMEHCEDDEEEEDDADNLHGYLEDSSFHLHGDLSMEDEVPPFHLHDLGLVSEPFVLQGTLGNQWRSAGEESRESLRGLASDLSNHLDDLELLGLSSQRRHGSSGSNMSVDCGEQGWGEEEEEEEDQHMRCGRSSKTGSSCSLDQRCSCCELSQNFQEHSFPGPFSECQRGYGSDSSCSSSDGVLVNFSAIYNKMNHPLSAPTNTNCSTDHSRPSSVSDPLGGQKGPAAGAFYLDLHSSPTQPLPSQQQTSVTHGNPFPVLCEPHLSTCSSSAEHQELHGLDANCNSYHALHSGSSGDLTSCLQSQARMVVATQNYYKLVTCDLSSQSSPSPVGSSITSCSDEQSKESPSPSKPSEYYLFKRQPGGDVLEEEDRQERASSLRDEDKREDEEETNQQLDESEIQGQVYVNIPPPVIGRGSIGGRPRSRSYDRHLDKASPSRLGSLERMLSCPVRLSDTAAQPTTPPPRVTSFAEIARSKRRTGGVASGRSPTLKAGADSFSSSYSAHCHASLDICPLPEQHDQDAGLRCSPMEHNMPGARETRSKAEGGDGGPLVVQRPTTLPIQPFTFQHQLAFKPPQAKPLLPLITGYVSGVQAHAVSGSRSSAGGTEEKEAEDPSENTARPPPGSVRPSPLGSYSPVRHQGAVSSGTCSTCTPSPPPACSLSFPLQTQALAKQPPTLSHPPLGLKNGSQGHCHLHGAPPSLQERHCDGLGPLGSLDSGKHPDGNKGPGCRPYNAHHLSPQALKWREYRRRNPLGLEKSSEGPFGTRPGGLDPQGLQCSRRNVFDFPAAPLGHALCSHAGHQSSYSDLLDYFSLTEKPPEEFCLSPDDSSSSSNISVDLPHKRGLVKAVNTAVDLIVAHFGTSRDPDIKAKLGNSWVTPNVGHLILKYLCPALHEILQDGLKAYVLDLIVGQRRCHVWSLVEASTQLGPSTRVLHALFYKVSQYPELSGHSMRLNAFIFGLLNLRSLELWFNHLYTRDDIIAAHYSPWGFLPLLQGPCLALLEELLLVLQPLSLLPFDLDVLFEPHLLQKDQEHLRRKEQLCSTGHGSDQSTCSTFQLMRGWSSAVSQSLREGGDARAKEKKERAGLRREGTWPRMEGAGSLRDGWDNVVTTKGLDSRNTTMDGDVSSQWAGQGTRNQRMKSARAVSQGEGGERDKSKERERDLDRKAGWWYQLMQSSQVYIDQSAEGSKFIKSEKRKKSSERRQLPPTREGVVEGAESCQEAEEVGKRSSVSTSREARCSRRPSWMGSPPESVLNQEKATHGAEEAVVPATAPGQSLPQGPSLRWSRLFGSNIGSSPRTKGAEQRAKPQKSRTLSGWLALDRSVLQLKAMAAGTGSKEESPHSPNHNNTVHPTTTAQTTATKPHSPCEVRALCQHRATEPGQLSFNKGARLKVLSRVDPDWLLCSLGFSQGLVPIVYVTLDGMEDRQ